MLLSWQARALRPRENKLALIVKIVPQGPPGARRLSHTRRALYTVGAPCWPSAAPPGGDFQGRSLLLCYPPLPSITFSLCPHAASIETAVYILKGEHQEIDPQAPHWSVGRSNSLTVGDDETSQPWNAKHYFIYMVFSIKSKTLRMSIYFSRGWIVLGISGITCFVLHAAGWTTIHKWLWLA